jgi:transposase-like protein
MKKRKQHSPEKKAEIVIRVLKEEETLAQIASEYGIHPNQVTRWKQQFLKDASVIFKNDHKPLNDLKMKYDKEMEVLYGEIGRLTTQLNWLKKKSGITLE